MRKSWLVCALMGALIGNMAWGQAQPGTAPASQAPPAQAMPGQAPAAESTPPAEVPMSAVVLTIKGVCPATTPVASKTPAAAKPATPAAKKPADCKTELTRAQFEEIAKGVSGSPNISPQMKRQLEQRLPQFMAMSEIAKKKGLDKSPQYLETLKIAKMNLLTNTLTRSVTEEADKIPADQIVEQYKSHPETYQQFSLDRLFVSRYKQVTEDKDDEKEPEKLTEEQQKAKEAAEKAKQEKGEQEMAALADGLRTRAAAGEDFAKLQKEAFEAAGQKVENPTVNLPKVRRTGLPPAHAAVFDLKVGEVSALISDNGGHYIYKVVSMEVLPFDQVKDEIHNKMKGERQKEMMDKYTNSFTAVPNEAYFGPAAAPGAPPHMRPRMNMPPTPQGQPQAAPAPATNAPATPPAAAAPTVPPAKPN
jgi:hypothetical protein